MAEQINIGIVGACGRGKSFKTACEAHPLLNIHAVCDTNEEKLDEAQTYGALFEVPRATQVPISYLTTGQDVPDDIEVAGPERIAKLMLKPSQETYKHDS